MKQQRTIRPRDKGDVPDDPLSRMRHSASHVMADAVRRLRPNAKVAIGPSIENGFYYDFDTEPFAPEDAARIEAEMTKIVAENLPFVRHVVPRAEALERFASRGEKYKVEIIESIPEGEEVSYFQHGDFIDLCRGPHVERTGDIKAFKVLSFAGAYWRGDERNAQLQRVYGTAFPSQAELDAHLARIEEAKRRDHRTLGKELDLFSFDDLVGPGFALWHPKGAMVRYQIEDVIRRENVRRGYELVYTPHLAREQLLETSGHLAHYKDNLFGGMELDGQRYLVKPMNCPFHVAIYRSQLRSYRDLPLRYSELGTVYRYERSGVLHGLLRVRGLTMDDGHLFVREDQIADEIAGCMTLALDMLEPVRLQGLRSLPGDPPGELHGRAGGLGPRRGGAARGAREDGPTVPGRRGRRRVLRPEDRPQDQGCARPRVAVLDLPARLPAPGALPARVRRAPTAPASGRS